MTEDAINVIDKIIHGIRDGEGEYWLDDKYLRLGKIQKDLHDIVNLQAVEIERLNLEVETLHKADETMTEQNNHEVQLQREIIIKMRSLVEQICADMEMAISDIDIVLNYIKSGWSVLATNKLDDMKSKIVYKLEYYNGICYQSYRTGATNGNAITSPKD